MTLARHGRVRHRLNPELGVGRVVAHHPRSIEVEFPDRGITLRLARTSDVLVPVTYARGSTVRIVATGQLARVAGVDPDGGVALADGRTVGHEEIWPVDTDRSLVERLATGDLDRLDDVALRLDALHLAITREAEALGPFLGGRIRLFPHQLYVAERASRSDPVRWLLADEVGLGKTVEACLIASRLLRTGRVARVLVVAPATLTVQWLGELWRKYHQVFVLVDDDRLRDVDREYGAGFNPFDAYGRAIVALELLRSRPALVEQAAAAGIDLLIVDEAHHLRRPAGHPGSPEYRAIRPLADAARHALLLTATPLEDDAHGFFRLLQMLRPAEFPEEIDVEARLASGRPLPPCTSATRRGDIGGLPPRVGIPVDVGASDEADPRVQLERALLAEPAGNPLAARRKAERVRRAQAGGAAFAAVLERSERGASLLADLARRSDASDPRLAWLAREARGWRDRGDKTLVFVAHRETLEWIREGLSRLAQVRVGVFHEDLSPARRDIEVAQFRSTAGPSMLVSTECGGEGRNFEFCTRLVLFDLPWNPMVVEQRIGRLDRIGRSTDVEIRYFRPSAGLGASLVALYEQLGLFREPLGGMARELALVEPAVERAVAEGASALDARAWTRILEAAALARSRIREAAYHELHREPYRADMAPAILARVPEDLEEATREVVVETLERLGMHVEPVGGRATYAVEFGNRATVESLPGVPGTSRFVGTFDRKEAVEEERLDFLASGHPLVEGVLAQLDDAPLGRVGIVALSGDGPEGAGLAAVYRVGPRLEAVAVDLEGTLRPEWAALVLARPFRARRVDAASWTRQPGWDALVRRLADRLPGERRPEWLAAITVAKRR